MLKVQILIKTSSQIFGPSSCLQQGCLSRETSQFWYFILSWNKICVGWVSNVIEVAQLPHFSTVETENLTDLAMQQITRVSFDNQVVKGKMGFFPFLPTMSSLSKTDSGADAKVNSPFPLLSIHISIQQHNMDPE